MMMFHHLRLFVNLLKGFYLARKVQDLYGHPVCRSCTLAPLRVSAFSGFSPLWAYPCSWVVPSCGLSPYLSFKLLDFVDEEQRLQLRFKLLCSCISEICREVRNSDKRVVPPGVVLSMPSGSLILAFNVITISVLASVFYARYMVLSFLQGIPCHLLLFKLCVCLGYSPVLVLNKLCCSIFSFVLLLWESDILVRWTLMSQGLDKLALLCCYEATVPNPPPAPNILMEECSGFHLLWKKAWVMLACFRFLAFV